MEQGRKEDHVKDGGWGEAEEELNIMRIKTGRQWPETIGGGRIVYAQPRTTIKCSA